MAANPPRRGSRLRDGWRKARAWPSLVRGTGFGFVAIALLQVTLITERVAGAAPADDPAAEMSPGEAPPSDPLEQPVGCEPRLLQAIEERNRQLDARFSDLADRTRMLEAIETRAAEQVRALEAQRRALEKTLAGIEEGSKAEIARLVKIYETMNPKEAARLFEAMPAEIAAGFIRRMNEGKSALIMGRLAAEHAYAIALAVANNPEPPSSP